MVELVDKMLFRATTICTFSSTYRDPITLEIIIYIKTFKKKKKDEKSKKKKKKTFGTRSSRYLGSAGD